MTLLQRESRRTLLGALFLWSAATVLEATVLTAQEDIALGYALAGTAIRYAILGLLAIPVWRICRKLAEPSVSGLRAAAAHAAMGLIVIGLWCGSYLLFFYVQVGSLVFLQLEQVGLWQLLSAIVTYTMLVAGIVAVQTSRRLHDQRRREDALRLLAREAEIRALRAQLRPHFLFNTLNSIYSLIGDRPDQAREMVATMSDLMRQTLEFSDESLVPLRQELDIVEKYLQIEKIRLGDRLTVALDTDRVSGSIEVPPFLLQPLVENAVKHGVASCPGPGAITVSAQPSSSGIEFRIRDTGPGLATRSEWLDGRGIAITEKRLKILYGDDYRLSLCNLNPKGFEARLCIPIPNILDGGHDSHDSRDDTNA